jgi:hypothetical protein
MPAISPRTFYVWLLIHLSSFFLFSVSSPLYFASFVAHLHHLYNLTLPYLLGP